MFQLRDRHGDAYNIARDIIQLFPHVVRQAMYRLGEDAWSPLIRDYALATGLDNNQLVEAAVAMRKFIAVVMDGQTATPADAFVQCGFDRLTNPAKAAVLMQIGAGVMSHFYHHARAANPAGRVPRGTALAEDLTDRVAHALKAETPRQRKKRVRQIKGEVKPPDLRDLGNPG